MVRRPPEPARKVVRASLGPERVGASGAEWAAKGAAHRPDPASREPRPSTTPAAPPDLLRRPPTVIGTKVDRTRAHRLPTPDRRLGGARELTRGDTGLAAIGSEQPRRWRRLHGSRLGRDPVLPDPARHLAPLPYLTCRRTSDGRIVRHGTHTHHQGAGPMSIALRHPQVPSALLAVVCRWRHCRRARRRGVRRHAGHHQFGHDRGAARCHHRRSERLGCRPLDRVPDGCGLTDPSGSGAVLSTVPDGCGRDRSERLGCRPLDRVPDGCGRDRSERLGCDPLRPSTRRLRPLTDPSGGLGVLFGPGLPSEAIAVDTTGLGAIFGVQFPAPAIHGDATGLGQLLWRSFPLARARQAGMRPAARPPDLARPTPSRACSRGCRWPSSPSGR